MFPSTSPREINIRTLGKTKLSDIKCIIFNVTPSNVSNLFTYSSRHHHNTRFSAAGNFYIKHSRMDHLKNSFSRIVAKIWNSIPDSDRAPPKYKLKNILQIRLLDILIQEDTYLGVRALIDIYLVNIKFSV